MNTEHLLLSVSIGCVVFLIQKTDFVYEYLSLIIRKTGKEKLIYSLNIFGYEKSDGYDNFILYLYSIYSSEKNIRGFFFRLISCFICLSTLLNLVVFSALNSLIFIFPGAVVSMLSYFVLDKIAKSVYLK